MPPFCNAFLLGPRRR